MLRLGQGIHEITAKNELDLNHLTCGNLHDISISEKKSRCKIVSVMWPHFCKMWIEKVYVCIDGM